MPLKTELNMKMFVVCPIYLKMREGIKEIDVVKKEIKTYITIKPY